MFKIILHNPLVFYLNENTFKTTLFI